MSKELEYKFLNLHLCEFDTKAANGAGTISGYASVTNVIDDGGDVIVTGAYADTIKDFLSSGFVCHSHDWNVSGVVAFPVEAKEDGKGLLVKAQFHSTPDAQAVRTKADERMKAGLQVGLSIGYRPSADPLWVMSDQYASELPKYIKPELLAENLAKAQRWSRIRILPKVELREFSIVTSPMNRMAEATAVKSSEGDQRVKPEEKTTPEKTQDEPAAPAADVKGYFESAMLEREANEGLWRYYDALQTGLRQLREDAESGEEANPVGALRDLIQAFATRVYADIAPLFQESEADAGAIALRGLTSLSTLLALKDAPHAGMKFDEHSETVLAAVQEFATQNAALMECLRAFGERGKSIQEIRAKAGRAISTARMEKIGQARDRIKETMSHMQGVVDHLDELMAEATPKPAEEEPKAEPAEDYSAEARSLEAAILKARIESTATQRAA